MTKVQDDHIGPWTEQKIDVLRKYASAYSTILADQNRFHFSYIDAFASSGQHISRTSGQVVLGSALSALRVKPPFQEYHLVELNPLKAEQLRRRVGDQPNVHIHQGDSNVLLREKLLPAVQWKQFRRALCILDPYGLDLDWTVIEMAGQQKTIDLFINFAIHDANRNALWREGSQANPVQAGRLTRIWGDESWKDLLYTPDLFGDRIKDGTNADVAKEYKRRLKTVAGFDHVAEPLVLRNSIGAAVFYLFFASHNATAARIARDIFSQATRRNRNG